MANPLSGTKLLFVLAGVGVIGGIAAAIVSAQREAPQQPVFAPAANPYANGIYANGIVESSQENGANTNLYPEVNGTVTQVKVREDQNVKRGDVLIQLDDRAQRATVEQLEAQAQAAHHALDELRAQPRPEVLAVAQAQLASALASAQLAQDAYNKRQQAYDLDPNSLSRDVLDTALHAWKVADANHQAAQRNVELVKAGAWTFDVETQESNWHALQKSAQAARVLLDKFAIRAPFDGKVLAIHVHPGTLVSPNGVYNTYTQASNDPLMVFGNANAKLQVRCYVDEVLIPRLNQTKKGIKANMFIRGTANPVPMQFVRVEPYVTPKISLSDQRQERVDLRVLPVIFEFVPQSDMPVYPGQLVDVYIGN